MEIPEPALARAYLAEFNQMWGDTGTTPNPDSAKFHEDKRDRLSTHEFTVNGSRARLYFAPQDRVVDTITALVNQAQREVGFAINAFTFDNLGTAMLGLFNSGKRVFGTFDNASAMDSTSEYWHLRPAHVPVKIDSFPYGNGTVHEKIMVIDSAITVTGSANWSANADYSNDENTLILYDTAIARRFVAEIVTRYMEAGGTYPPAVAEPSAEPARQARSGLSSPRRASARFPARALLYDACGRRLAGRPAGAVVLVRVPGASAASAVLLR
jgi:phosphatidylserine/phosphatidylglycerophosphate/cardiolipin synthase-like enzyme